MQGGLQRVIESKGLQRLIVKRRLQRVIESKGLQRMIVKWRLQRVIVKEYFQRVIYSEFEVVCLLKLHFYQISLHLHRKCWLQGLEALSPWLLSQIMEM